MPLLLLLTFKAFVCFCHGFNSIVSATVACHLEANKMKKKTHLQNIRIAFYSVKIVNRKIETNRWVRCARNDDKRAKGWKVMAISHTNSIFEWITISMNQIEDTKVQRRETRKLESISLLQIFLLQIISFACFHFIKFCTQLELNAQGNF